LRAGLEPFAGRIWPVGRTLGTVALDHETKMM